MRLVQHESATRYGARHYGIKFITFAIWTKQCEFYKLSNEGTFFLDCAEAQYDLRWATIHENKSALPATGISTLNTESPQAGIPGVVSQRVAIQASPSGIEAFPRLGVMDDTQVDRRGASRWRLGMLRHITGGQRPLWNGGGRCYGKWWSHPPN